MLETARIFFGQLMSAMRPNGMPLLLKITLSKDIGRSSQNLSLSAQIFDLMELGGVALARSDLRQVILARAKRRRRRRLTRTRMALAVFPFRGRAGFMFQKPGLACDTATVACKRTISSDDAMTRHDNSNRI